MKESKNRVVLYEHLSRKLAGDGISQEEIESIKDLPIGHHSVEGLIKINQRLGYIIERGGKFYGASSLDVELTANEGKLLEEKAEKSGLSPTEFVSDIVLKALSTN